MQQISSKPKAIIICGPTGIGKTAFAIELAMAFQGEIIGADSMQVYRQLDIGTAKPSPAEQAMVAHHMVDIVDPDAPFDAEAYAEMAFAIILALEKRRVLPYVVGGTGLYIKSLIYGLFEAPPVNDSIRVRLRQAFEKVGGDTLFNRLKQVDPVTAAKLHVNDTYRVMRALEVYEITGLPISEFQHRHQFQESRLATLKLGLTMDRDRLYARIDRRVEMMIAEGLLDEVRGLLASGYSARLKPMQSIGYRHMIDFLEGRLDWPETVQTLKRDTRRYAKRQMTWFGADTDVVWVDPVVTPDVKETIRSFLAGASASQA